MITVDDKIKTFSKYVYEKEVKLSKEKLKAVELSNKKALDAKIKEAREESNRLIEKMNKRIEMDSQKIIASAKNKAKINVLSTEKKLLDNFNEELCDLLIQYTKTEGYSKLLRKIFEQFKDILSSQNVKVFLTDKDISHFAKELHGKYDSIEIDRLDDENIGGIIIESTLNRERIDLTLRRKVHDWKSEIGIRLYEALEK